MGDDDDDDGKTAARSEEDDTPVLFINVVIQDASGAIQEGVAKKISEKKNLPPRLKERLTKVVGKVASDVVSASMIAEKVAPKLCEVVPKKMEDKGLAVDLEVVFREGPYFVLMMQITHVDASILTEAQKSHEPAGSSEAWTTKAMRTGLGWMGLTSAVENGFLPNLVQKKMQSQMGEMMEGQFAEKKLRASVEVMTEEKQARYFYSLLQQFRSLKGGDLL